MAEDGGAFVGAEDLGGAAVGVMQAGLEALVRAVLGEDGPEIDVDVLGAGSAALFGPVNPAAVGAVAFAIEPALIAAHQFAREGGAVCPGRGGFAGVGVERVGE